MNLLKCLFWPAFSLLGQNVARPSHILSYHLFWHLLPSWRGWSCAALSVCPASHQRNTMWPNCVKPILTHSCSLSLSFYNGSTGSQNHGHCTHPSPPLMEVGAALQILQPAHIPALNRPPSCSFLPSPHSTSAFRRLGQGCKTARIEQRRNDLKYVQMERSRRRSLFLEDPDGGR